MICGGGRRNCLREFFPPEKGSQIFSPRRRAFRNIFSQKSHQNFSFLEKSHQICFPREETSKFLFLDFLRAHLQTINGQSLTIINSLKSIAVGLCTIWRLCVHGTPKFILVLYVYVLHLIIVLPFFSTSHYRRNNKINRRYH